MSTRPKNFHSGTLPRTTTPEPIYRNAFPKCAPPEIGPRTSTANGSVKVVRPIDRKFSIVSTTKTERLHDKNETHHQCNKWRSYYYKIYNI